MGCYQKLLRRDGYVLGQNGCIFLLDLWISSFYQEWVVVVVVLLLLLLYYYPCKKKHQ